MLLDLVQDVLAKAGVKPAELLQKLAAVVVDPPPGTIDVGELRIANEAQVALLAAIVAAGGYPQYSQALAPLLAYAQAREDSLSDYDSGRLWHLTGYAAWQQDDLFAFSTATRALNRSVALLEKTATLPAKQYLGRVFNTSGALLYREGLLQEARVEFGKELEHRRAVKDADGVARTQGSLGRLYMELGDFMTAARYLTQDLRHLLKSSSSPTTQHWQTQLLSELGTCALELSRQRTGKAQQDKLQEAEKHFTESDRLARATRNADGLAFAALGLGRVALLRNTIAEVRRQVQTARKHLQNVQPYLRDGLDGCIHQLTAEISLAQRRPRQALRSFQAASESLRKARGTSPVEMARLLHSFARAHRACQQDRQAAALFHEALQRLDGTEAAQMRLQIEQEMRQASEESWQLHATGRVVGHDHVQFILNHSGYGALPSSRENVVILFSDVRQFTTLTQHFASQAEEFVNFLNDYFRHMTRCVEQHGGFVDKFIGDAVMAVFSLPQPRLDKDAEQAVLAALMMREELARFNRKQPENMPHFNIGIGLHAGVVNAGLIGSPQKRSYTVIGNEVNVASRLEGMTKNLGASILISQTVRSRLPRPDRFLLRPLGRYYPKGSEEWVEVFDVMGENDGTRVARAIQAEIIQIEDALQDFRRGQFARAAQALQRLVKQTAPEARAKGYELLAHEADKYRKKAPKAPWEGAVVLEEK